MPEVWSMVSEILQSEVLQQTMLHVCYTSTPRSHPKAIPVENCLMKHIEISLQPFLREMN